MDAVAELLKITRFLSWQQGYASFQASELRVAKDLLRQVYRNKDAMKAMGDEFSLALYEQWTHSENWNDSVQH